MIKRRFYKLEHGDKDSGSDSSCFSSDSDPETEESEQSEEEDSVAEVSEDGDDSGDDESPAAGEDADVDDGDDNSDADDYGGTLEKMSMNRFLEEPPEEEEENYILGCMIQSKSVYKCRYCPTVVCLNENTMQAHVSSKKHARMEKLVKEGKIRTDDEEVDDLETASQVTLENLPTSAFCFVNES
jgi:hypothetical protein